MSTLELRYRRLLALYPPSYRYRYQEEMLGTLMEGAAPAQQSPRLRESLDLVWNAMWLRLTRRGLPRGRDARWAAAAGVFGFLGAMGLFAISVSAPARGVFLLWMDPWQPAAIRQSAVVSGAWLLVAGLAIAGWRRIAAVGAWVTVLAVAVPKLLAYPEDPPRLVSQWPVLVLATTTAICLSLRPPRLARELLGRRLTLIASASLLVAGSAPWLDLWVADIDYDGGNGYRMGSWGGNYPFVPGHDTVGVLPLLIYSVSLVVLLRMLVKVGAGLRRRLLVIATVPVAMYLVVEMFYAGFAASSMRFWPTPVMLTVGQWLGLLLLPPLFLAGGVLRVRRLDDRQQLIELGRAAKLTQAPTSGDHSSNE